MPRHPKHSRKYPPDTRAVLCTNVNGGDDVMVFTTLTAGQLQATYQRTAVTMDECYEVPERDLGVYLYEPCWLTLAEEARAREILAQAA